VLIDSYRADDIEMFARFIRVPVVWCRVRCAHGFTREQICDDCENGFSTDGHEYADPRGPVAADEHGEPLIGSTDDGYDACYIPGRFQEKVDACPTSPAGRYDVQPREYHFSA